jgi:protein-S-isoprenylcysteine O-methyltransferase Ste14
MADAGIAGNRALAQRAKNFAASMLFLTVSFLVYRYSPHSAGLRLIWNESIGISGTEVLTIGCISYSVLLLLFYFLERTPRQSKSVAAVWALRSLLMSPARTLREGLPYNDRLGLLTVLLKGFFAPLMVLFLFDQTRNLLANGAYLLSHAPEIRTSFLAVFNSHGFWFLFQLVLFLDVVFFTVGYLVEHPALKNEIRSVDPTWLGWAVALACYPPFNGVVTKVLGWTSADFPQLDNLTAHFAASAAVLLLMGIYTSASVALNLKASNLTHRGIISHGPYRFVRHPAYVCKNLAWWIGTVPAILAAWEHRSAWDGLVVAGSSLAWTAVYVLRALTEEDHLRKVNGEYEAYSQKVRYRFVPGVF